MNIGLDSSNRNMRMLDAECHHNRSPMLAICISTVDRLESILGEVSCPLFRPFKIGDRNIMRPQFQYHEFLYGLDMGGMPDRLLLFIRPIISLVEPRMASRAYRSHEYVTRLDSSALSVNRPVAMPSHRARIAIAVLARNRTANSEQLRRTHIVKLRNRLNRQCCRSVGNSLPNGLEDRCDSLLFRLGLPLGCKAGSAVHGFVSHARFFCHSRANSPQ
jgi:hypothetical protein